MICISIAQESRRLALVDMLNAARQCDLLEIQMDRFDKAPDVAELLANKPKPIILSCRRPQDGGNWQGNEEERLALLRQCIISKADYVEIEVDVADQIRKLPPCKRVISYTNMLETPDNIAEIYAEAQTKSPDVIKLVTVVRTPEEAWPMLQLLAKPPVPTVVVGLGKPGVMLTVLGKKIGAPWTYAALERGMEAYPDQPTVHDLNEVYHYKAIGTRTPLVAVTGLSEREYTFIGALNAGFAQLGFAARCLPIQVGSIKLFRKVMEAIRFVGVLVGPAHQRDFLQVAAELEPAAAQAQAPDLLLHEDRKVWKGYNLLWRAAGSALEATLREKLAADKPLHDRTVMIVGADAMAQAVALGIKARGGIPIVASRDRKAAQQIAQDIGCRFIPFEAMYTTRHDILVVCDLEEEHVKGKADEGVHAGYLKPSIVVMDLTAAPRKSVFLRDAMRRGCDVVDPRRVMLEQAVLLLRMMTEQEVDRDKLATVLAELVPEEEE